MNYIDEIVFRMFKTLTDEQKYDLLEELALENKELKEQLSICDVVKSFKNLKGLTFDEWLNKTGYTFCEKGFFIDSGKNVYSKDLIYKIYLNDADTF